MSTPYSNYYVWQMNTGYWWLSRQTPRGRQSDSWLLPKEYDHGYKTEREARDALREAREKAQGGVTQ